MDKYCQNCNQQNAPDAPVCSQCAAPFPLNETRGQVIFKAGWRAIVMYAVMGIFFLSMFVYLQLTVFLKTKELFSSGSLLLWGILTLFFTPLWYFLVTQSRRVLKTHIALDDLGLRLNIPVWAYNHWKPGQEVRLGWNEVECVTYDRCYTIKVQEVYGYKVYTSRGTYKLTSLLGVDAEKIAHMIAARAGRNLEYIIPKPTDAAAAKANKRGYLLLFFIAVYTVTAFYLLITSNAK